MRPNTYSHILRFDIACGRPFVFAIMDLYTKYVNYQAFYNYGNDNMMDFATLKQSYKSTNAIILLVLKVGINIPNFVTPTIVLIVLSLFYIRPMLLLNPLLLQMRLSVPFAIRCTMMMDFVNLENIIQHIFLVVIGFAMLANQILREMIMVRKSANYAK